MMPEWLRKIIERMREAGVTPTPDTWMDDMFKWYDTGKIPRQLPGKISPTEAVLTHLPSLIGGFGKALGEETSAALPGFLEAMDPRQYFKPSSEETPPTETPTPTPPVIQFGGQGSLPTQREPYMSVSRESLMPPALPIQGGRGKTLNYGPKQRYRKTARKFRPRSTGGGKPRPV